MWTKTSLLWNLKLFVTQTCSVKLTYKVWRDMPFSLSFSPPAANGCGKWEKKIVDTCGAALAMTVCVNQNHSLLGSGFQEKSPIDLGTETEEKNKPWERRGKIMRNVRAREKREKSAVLQVPGDGYIERFFSFWKTNLPIMRPVYSIPQAEYILASYRTSLQDEKSCQDSSIKLCYYMIHRA